ncbi:PREDICTED: aldehyde oxidase GLOX [Tarenaya hassleriana]|uniref:aldehyde oxidase GLOX n=1 Tax=Tarenaya hassleriana TaxID=28532 RepID=UPI00053C107F|nr:PREDICTED: aldehyde oxidase GLOX [Tarenaya hassleriana]
MIFANKSFFFIITIIIIISISFMFLSESQPIPYPTKLDRWQLLQSNIGISAMHMQLLHNDMVIMFDRTDFGTSNISLPGGLCRYDPYDTAVKFDCTAHSVIYDVVSNTYRPLKVQTDTWCSSGSVLPNGTLVQTGGYNDGERVMRMFTPCGYGETCDWIEFPRYLANRRWYATNQILPDGRIIVVGGRRQFNFEFFPRVQSNIRGFRFDFLRETSDGSNENNLYPFVHLLPDGNLFVFANTRSILFDYRRNKITKEYPEIPGGDPRNYPSSGSSILLPLQETYNPNKSIEVEVMVCGGAPKGSFTKANKQQTFARAVSTCGRMRLTDENPSWQMETMPLPRVMSDMLLLPTGDVIIVNGAASGTAGWENAHDPVTRPIIYRPYDHRFSVMSTSARPRMYHSSAILLSDGRILVGGSNPHIYYNFTNVEYPTDLSLEVYSPPYISSIYDPFRPKILNYDKILNYERLNILCFSIQEFISLDRLSVRIISPSFTTHSFAMNQRMVVLRLHEVAHHESGPYWITAFGPSTAEIAPPGYYMMFVVHAGVPSSGVWVKLE